MWFVCGPNLLLAFTPSTVLKGRIIQPLYQVDLGTGTCYANQISHTLWHIKWQKVLVIPPKLEILEKVNASWCSTLNWPQLFNLLTLFKTFNISAIQFRLKMIENLILLIFFVQYEIEKSYLYFKLSKMCTILTDFHLWKK